MEQNLTMFSLKGKTALVTGANTGLGQGICVAYAATGANVIGVARRSCQETAEKIAAISGNFTEIIADLSDTNIIPRIVEEANKVYGRVDILVNNAGIIKRCDSVDVTIEDWEAVININEKMYFSSVRHLQKIGFPINKEAKSLILHLCSVIKEVSAFLHILPAKALLWGLPKHLQMNGQNTISM